MSAVMGDSINRLDDFKDKAMKIYPSVDACVARYTVHISLVNRNAYSLKG